MLYGVSLATKSESYHQLQEFKEVSTKLAKLTEQPQSDEWLELKRNEAYVTTRTFQLPTVDSVIYDEIQNV